MQTDAGYHHADAGNILCCHYAVTFCNSNSIYIWRFVLFAGQDSHSDLNLYSQFTLSVNVCVCREESLTNNFQVLS